MEGLQNGFPRSSRLVEDEISAGVSFVKHRIQRCDCLVIQRNASFFVTLWDKCETFLVPHVSLTVVPHHGILRSDAILSHFRIHPAKPGPLQFNRYRVVATMADQPTTGQ